MILSELEAHCKNLREKHGDLPVFVTSDGLWAHHLDIEVAYVADPRDGGACSNTQDFETSHPCILL